MQAIALVEFGIGGHTVKEEWIENDRMSRGKRRIDGIEGAHIIGAHIARRPHAGEQHGDMTILEFLQDAIERRLGHIRIDPAQGVVGAEFEDHRLGAFRDRPVEAAEPAGGGIAGHPGIDDRRGDALGLERLPPALAGKAASAGSPKPALSESPSTTIFTGRSAAAEPPAGASAQNIVTRASAARRWTRTAFVPYERGRERWNHMTNNSQAGPAIAQPAIELAGVNLSLGQGAARVHILKDIDLNIGSGEAIGLVGPSGSGKSTLLMVMAGLERADTGTVAVAGENLGALDEDALARFRGRNVGIVFQSFHLIPTMTALENVAVPLELAGVADAQERARGELAAVGLGERLHHYPAELSGGEQQRVAVARALAPNPAILVADEPTGNLDEDTGQQIIDLLFAGHAKRGTTLVLVTHDAALAARCGRVVRLRSGRIDGVRHEP